MSSKKCVASRPPAPVESSMSLDASDHLVEDDRFDTHRGRLFRIGKQALVVYFSNDEQMAESDRSRVRHPAFVDWAADRKPYRRLVRISRTKFRSRVTTRPALSATSVFLLALNNN